MTSNPIAEDLETTQQTYTTESPIDFGDLEDLVQEVCIKTMWFTVNRSSAVIFSLIRIEENSSNGFITYSITIWRVGKLFFIINTEGFRVVP